ncbi:hypothetical protein [Actinomadura sp. HBU206391]|nr:hypothetical protein [Actinomadura sp. HBU206391]
MGVLSNGAGQRARSSPGIGSPGKAQERADPRGRPALVRLGVARGTS